MRIVALKCVGMTGRFEQVYKMCTFMRRIMSANLDVKSERRIGTRFWEDKSGAQLRARNRVANRERGYSRRFS